MATERPKTSGKHMTEITITYEGSDTTIMVDEKTLIGLKNRDQGTLDFVVEIIRKMRTSEKDCSPTDTGMTMSDSDDLPDPAPVNNQIPIPGIPTAPTSWGEASEKLLLKLFKQQEELNRPVKNRWATIAKTMAKHEYDFSAEQCRLKIKSLKERHHRYQKKQDKSGEGAPDYNEVDQSMDEVFSSMPDVNPVFVVDSGSQSSSEVPGQLSSACKRQKGYLCSIRRPGSSQQAPQEVRGNHERIFLRCP
ncbi:uncharacterized protein LOC117327234 [Pecten maximus]|uniref:uncharacterized protein LOC117327234 n=1 Tax=Pecten maximus TaxID=6579 RepID=UPI0014583DCB|nr:uncharacterized protein LOC117327234 [Pecten maximus]